MSRIPVLLLALMSAAPAAAQEWQVAREQFAFGGSRLTIRVDVRSAGSLHLIRGAPGAVRVAGRAQRGFTGAGLSSDEELTLTAVGPGPVDFLVSVPEDVWIDVRLPGRHLRESVTGRTRSRSFEWGGEGDARDEPVPEWVPPIATEGTGALYTTFASGSAPAEVDVPDLVGVHSLSVRIEGDRFRIETGRPLSVEEGSPDRFVIRPARPPMDLVLTLPATTRDFQLRAAGSTILVVDGHAVTSLCEPLTDQWLSDGRRWLTFNPRDGTLVCNPETVRRHEG